MIHVKRGISLFLTCLAAGIVLPAAAAAGPTGMRVPESPATMRSVMNRETLDGASLRGESRVGDTLQVQASPVHIAAPLSSAPVTTAPYIFSPRFLPAFWYGRSAIGEFAGDACTDSIYGSTLVSSVMSNPALTTGCFRGPFDGQNDLHTQLVPGENKDALYGRAYDPDANRFQ